MTCTPQGLDLVSCSRLSLWSLGEDDEVGASLLGS